jgi:hypothetical protein
MLFSRKWLIQFAFVWCFLGLIIGIFFVEEKALIIFAPVVSIIMFFFGLMGLMLGLGFQRKNPFVKSNSIFLWFAIVFFWSFGVIGFFYFLIGGAFYYSDDKDFSYFVIVGAVIPLGFSVGAAKEWEKSLKNE